MPIARFSGHLGFAALVLAATGLTSALAGAAPVIGLFTHYSWDDPYIAQIKGVIISLDPNARILDLVHIATPLNLTDASYVLDDSAEQFPADTIFTAAIEPPTGADPDPIVVETAKNKFFIGPDNGIFTQVIQDEGFSRAWKLDRPEYFLPGPGPRIFRDRDIFAAVAAHLAGGLNPDRLGTPIKTPVLLPIKDATFSNGTFAVEVLHVDHFGNVILNLRADNSLPAKLTEGNLVKISIGKDTYSGPLVKAFSDIGKDRLFLLYGGNGFLEITMNQGSAAKELKVDPGTVIFLKQ